MNRIRVIAYWNCFIPPNKYQIFFTDNTNLKVPDDESFLAENIRTALKGKGYKTWVDQTALAEVYKLVKDMPREKTSQYLLDDLDKYGH